MDNSSSPNPPESPAQPPAEPLGQTPAVADGGQKSRRFSSLAIRLMVGFPLLFVTLGLFALDAAVENAGVAFASPSRPFAGFLALMTVPAGVAMVWETRRMLAARNIPTRPILAFIAVPALMVGGYAAGAIAATTAENQPIAAVLRVQAFWVALFVFGGSFGFTVLTWIRVLWSGDASTENHQRRAFAAIGTTFIIATLGLPFALVLAIRQLPFAGFALLLLVILASRIGDVGAFFTGKALGRHKLIVAVSPKKTIEGTVGGLVTSAFVGWLVGLVFIDIADYLPGFWLPVTGLAIGAAAQIGDLLASALKRWAGFKDSSQLIPEFGGMLDLLDGLLFSVPSLYFILLLRAALDGSGFAV